MVKRLPGMWETQVPSLGWEDPLEKEMATHSSTLAWKIPWTEEPGRLRSMGLQRVGQDSVTSLLVSLSRHIITKLRFLSRQPDVISIQLWSLGMNSLQLASHLQTFHMTHPSLALPSDLRAPPWVFPYSKSTHGLDSRLASTFFRALPSTSQLLPVSLLSLYWFLPLGLWQPTPVFLLGDPRDRGAWRATVHGVAKSQIWLSV